MLQSSIKRHFHLLRLRPLLSPLPFRRLYSAELPPPPSASPPLPTPKLFVAGLSWTVDERSLHDAFSSFGEVTEVRILYDRNSGRSRGFGFVQFKSEDEARIAKEAMDGKALLGRPLRIDFALEKVRGTPVTVPRLFPREQGS